MSSKTGHFYEFSNFRLDAENPTRWLNESLVPLPPKALEMLALLVRRHNAVVSREELLETVWRDTIDEMFLNRPVPHAVPPVESAFGRTTYGNESRNDFIGVDRVTPLVWERRHPGMARRRVGSRRAARDTDPNSSRR